MPEDWDGVCVWVWLDDLVGRVGREGPAPPEAATEVDMMRLEIEGRIRSADVELVEVLSGQTTASSLMSAVCQ